ncbi:MAG: hypothetical protein K6G33_07465 [Ruminococcus sp.]|uniref:hypothetical protein n=1 Tax=Ruminococcus sp. TaxID=41978 RepID=UPI0025D01777|nr:hypothetical protein [Ruminococcus sp.]MCR5600561.1 hypothetical protein [Ruminococcus sp.]
MFAVNTYEQIEKREKELNEKHIVVLMFVKPSTPDADDIILEFNYLHHNSWRYCSIYAIGYSDNKDMLREAEKVECTVENTEWYYSDVEFIDFKNKLSRRIKWQYSGENEIIVLQSNPEGREILNFQNYVAINISKGLRDEYIESYNMFMEQLINSSKSEVESKKAVSRTTQFKIKDIAINAVSMSKKLPAPLRKVLKDRFFFKTSRCKL